MSGPPRSAPLPNPVPPLSEAVQPVKDPALQQGLEQAYSGITQALARRDDVEVAVQFGISLFAVARIRAMLGVSRTELITPTQGAQRAQAGRVAPTGRALPTRLVGSRD